MAQSRKILLVDDDAEVVQAMKVVLENRGYVVVTASDGNAGLAAAEQECPDLVVVDMMMPKKSGFLVLEKLKSAAWPAPRSSWSPPTKAAGTAPMRSCSASTTTCASRSPWTSSWHASPNCVRWKTREKPRRSCLCIWLEGIRIFHDADRRATMWCDAPRRIE